jgi:hypothetical protein
MKMVKKELGISCDYNGDRWLVICFLKKKQKRFLYLTATAQYDFIIVNTRFQKKYKKTIFSICED